MNRTKAAVAALTAAVSAAPLAAASGDEAQFILSGDPVAAETAGSTSASSAATGLTSGTLADGFVYGSELEARYRTTGESPARSLRSDEFMGMTITIR